MLFYLQLLESEEEKSKFERIYLRYRGLMFHVALRVLQDDAKAEDAVHNAFLAILKHLGKLTDPDSAQTRSFCVVIAERKAIDLLRESRHIVDADFDETVNGVEIPAPGDHGLADAMARLPARDREALLLRYAHGYSTAETAKLLGLSLSAMQKALQRAKERLKKTLEEADADET